MNDTMKYVDMAAFRKQTGLKQSDVANMLGTSSSFISLVETGAAKLPDEKIQRLIISYGPSGLVPCYDRLVNLVVRLVKEDYLDPVYLSNEIEPFQEELTRPVVEKIKFGRIGISNEIADKIVAAFPVVNEGWLLTGQGSMLYDNTEVRLRSIEERFDKIEESLLHLHNKLDWIATQLKQTE